MKYVNWKIYFNIIDKSIPFDIIFKNFGQIKIQILKIKQDLNLNYKDTCSPIMDRCRFVIINEYQYFYILCNLFNYIQVFT